MDKGTKSSRTPRASARCRGAGTSGMGAAAEPDVDDLFDIMRSVIQAAADGPAVAKTVLEAMRTPPPDAESTERYSGFSCEACHVEKVFDYEHAEMVCPRCGMCSAPLMFDKRSLSYEEETSKTTSSYSYKRSSHMADWISRVQGKCTHSIPTSLITTVQAELKKHRVPFEAVTAQKVRWVLRKIKQGAYYDQSPYLAFVISGSKEITISDELENILKMLFLAVERAFQRNHAKFKRHNFLSYSFTLYKLLELLGETELQSYFSLLKSSEKLHLQDAVWKTLTSQLNWPFIRTIV